MKPDAFLKKVADDNAVAPGTHDLAHPVRPAEIGRWKARHPGMKLPNDLLGFFKRVNGIRFHVSPASPIGAEARLLALRELDSATALLYQDQEEEGDALPGSWLALTDDAQGDAVLVLDVRKRVYLGVDPAEPEDAQEIGDRFEHALDWLFARYLDR